VRGTFPSRGRTGKRWAPSRRAASTFRASLSSGTAFARGHTDPSIDSAPISCVAHTDRSIYCRGSIQEWHGTKMVSTDISTGLGETLGPFEEGRLGLPSVIFIRPKGRMQTFGYLTCTEEYRWLSTGHLHQLVPSTRDCWNPYPKCGVLIFVPVASLNGAILDPKLRIYFTKLRIYSEVTDLSYVKRFKIGVLAVLSGSYSSASAFLLSRRLVEQTDLVSPCTFPLER